MASTSASVPRSCKVRHSASRSSTGPGSLSHHKRTETEKNLKKQLEKENGSRWCHLNLEGRSGSVIAAISTAKSMPLRPQS